MKKLNILFVILISTLFSCAQEKTANQPKIKSEEVIFYKVDEGGTRTRREGAGMDELVEYNSDGNIEKVYVIEYDQKNNKNTYNLHERYFYEGKNLTKKEKIGYRTGEVYEEISCKYQQNKLLRKDVKTIENGKEVLKKNGSFYSEYTYEPNKETGKVYEYDEEKKTFVLAYVQHKFFDAKKNLIQEKLEDKHGEIYQQNHLTYNSENKLIKDTQSKRFPSTVTYQYNKEGDVTENNYESEGTIVTKKYAIKYDFNGNWIEKTETKKSNSKNYIPDPTYIIKRKIVYY
ncbi:hypothetical protein [Pedobacter agri]|uniref:hypothetical protein n=1 Tax=Pedobacter agri TaxID=454586 RepID=UPI0027854163|nr:hypothetical protein [Pedobacter agri]MDQ1140765.1 hypothetical protein [Pedobacter agri]